MKRQDLYRKMDLISDEIIEKNSAEKFKRSRKPLFISLIAAACVALLAAGMLAALPFMLGGNEQPPVVEPPVNSDIDNTDIQESDESTINITATGSTEIFPWAGLTERFAIIDNIEATDEVIELSQNGKYMSFNKIKCNVVYSYNTDSIYDNIRQIKKENQIPFDELTEIYVTESVIEDIKATSAILIEVKLYANTGKPLFITKIDDDYKSVYLPINENKLIWKKDNVSGISYSLHNMNEGMEYYLSDEAIKQFPNMLFYNDMTVEEMIISFNAVEQAVKEWKDESLVIIP